MAEVGRLALRQEGQWWHAYYAFPDTMADANLLGSIRMTAVANPERKAAFMGLMQDVVSDLIESAAGVRPDWNEPQRAPEHERGGHS